MKDDTSTVGQPVAKDEAGAAPAVAESGETTGIAPARCDCPALPVPHVHEQGGPVAIEI